MLFDLSDERDHALRAITQDGSFRVITARTTHAAQGAIDAQQVGGEDARLFGELLTGAVLLREAMSPDQRLQAIIKHHTGANLVADTHPGGTTRGLVQKPLDVPFELGPQTLLTVVRVLDNGQLHQGVIDTSEANSLSDVLTSYLLSSEQVYSVLAVACELSEDHVVRAGGYMIQLLPGAHIDMLRSITQRVETLPPLTHLLRRTEAHPAHLLASLMGEDLPYKVLGDDDVHFGCNCSQARVLGALGTLGRHDLEELMEDDVLDIDCDYCGTNYQLDHDDLEELLAER